MKFSKLLTALAFCGALAAAPWAQAGTLNGTFGYVPSGDASFTGPTLGSATSVTVLNNDSINTIPATYLGNPNDFASGGAAPLALSDTVVVSPLTWATPPGITAVNLVNLLTFSSGTTPADRFEFSATKEIVGSSGTNELTVAFVGTLHDSAGVFGDNNASLVYSFNDNGAINYSATFSTPSIIVNVPEVFGGLTVLVSFATCGMLTLLRRRS
jgi:hypothetical protein